MSKVILFKRKILEPGETLTADHIKRALEQMRIDQALQNIGEPNKNQDGVGKIQKGDLEMDIRTTIQKLDKNIKGSEGQINKADRISKATAEEFLSQYADAERAANPKLTPEQAFAKAMTDCPTLGALAIGHSMEMARGHY